MTGVCCTEGDGVADGRRKTVDSSTSTFGEGYTGGEKGKTIDSYVGG